MKTANDFLKIREACAALGVKRTKLYELMKDNKIQAHKLGSLTIVSKDSIDTFLRNLPKGLAPGRANKKRVSVPEAPSSSFKYKDFKLLARKQIKKFVPATEMTLCKWEEEGVFPKRMKIGGRNFWLASEIKDWLQTHKRMRDEV